MPRVLRRSSLMHSRRAPTIQLKVMKLFHISHHLNPADLHSLKCVSRNFRRSISAIYKTSRGWEEYSHRQLTQPLYTPVTVVDWHTYYTIAAFLATPSIPLSLRAYNKASFERLAATEYDTATIHRIRQAWLLAAIEAGYTPEELELFGDKEMPATVELYTAVLERRDLLLWYWFRRYTKPDLYNLEAAFCHPTIARLYNEWAKRDADIRSLNSKKILSYNR